MRTVSIRTLRYEFPRVEAMLAEGEEITVTRRKRPIARLSPAASEPERPVEWPDIMARLKKTCGNKVLKVSAAELLRWERDRD